MNHFRYVAMMALLAGVALCWPGTAAAQFYKKLAVKPQVSPPPFTPPANTGSPSNTGLYGPPASNPFNNGIPNQFYNGYYNPYVNLNQYNPYASPYLNGTVNPFLYNPYALGLYTYNPSPVSPILQWQMGQLANYLTLNGAGANPYLSAPVVSQFGYYGNPWGQYPQLGVNPYAAYQFGPWMQNAPNGMFDQGAPNIFNQQGPFKAGNIGPDPANLFK